jgi:hypothetical protein
MDTIRKDKRERYRVKCRGDRVKTLEKPLYEKRAKSGV